MESIKEFIKNNITNIVSNYDRLDFNIYIDKKSYSIEFTVYKDQTQMQCYEMVDANIIKEKDLEDFFDILAEFIKKSEFFDENIINKYKFSIKK